MIRSAVDFLPRIIMMFTNFATRRDPYFGSGSTSRFAAPARRMRYAPPALGGLAPYFDRLCLRPATPAVSSVPRMMWYRIPGRSFTRPPRIMTIECSWRLWPTPGMYDVTSSPFVSLTRATLRSAEFGFLGVVVYTRMQTPRFCGHACIAGVFDFLRTASRPCRTSWLMVGMALRRRERRQNSDFITATTHLVNLFDHFRFPA